MFHLVVFANYVELDGCGSVFCSEIRFDLSVIRQNTAKNAEKFFTKDFSKNAVNDDINA